MNYAQIPGFSRYRIYEDGRVESNFQRGSVARDRWTFLSPQPSGPRGYRIVTLVNDEGKHWRTRLHVVVARAWHGPRPFPKAVVRHVDGNTNNHHRTNCLWGTYKQNEDDKLAHGTWWCRRNGGKLNYSAACEIRAKRKAGARAEDLAKEYGVTTPTIYRLLKGTIWRNQHG